MTERTGAAYPSASEGLGICREDPAPGACRQEGALGPRGVRLSELWSKLRDGRVALAEHFVTQRASYAALQVRSESEAVEHRLTPPQAEVFQRLIAGERQNAIAIELAISPAAVTLRAQRCIQMLGLDCKLSCLPLFLIMAALTASRGVGQGQVATIECVRDGNAGAALYRVARADLVLSATLSTAEQEIARMIVEGRSLPAIAGARRTTERTVSNQLRSIFGKLGVTGRLELIAFLAGDRAPLVHKAPPSARRLGRP
jgi:DNA-binding NarL/FixJ family response regulator